MAPMRGSTGEHADRVQGLGALEFQTDIEDAKPAPAAPDSRANARQIILFDIFHGDRSRPGPPSLSTDGSRRS